MRKIFLILIVASFSSSIFANDFYINDIKINGLEESNAKLSFLIQN